MSTLIISGSHRPNSQSVKVANYAKKILVENEVEAEVIDLAEVDLPFWDTEVWNADSEKWKKLWKPIEAKVEAADCFVFVAPEWGGMVPARLKNFFLFLNHYTSGHKPALIVAVSASSGGSYPVNELRISSYKNSKICYIPDHVIVRNVEQCFNYTNPSSTFDEYITKRLMYSLMVLGIYSENFKNIRQHEEIYNKSYPYGM